MTQPTSNGVTWLIRAINSAGTRYYCGNGNWCESPQWALQFPTKKAAELRSYGLADIHGVETVEHLSDG